MLTQSSIAHYLLSLGIVKPSAVVEDELSVLDASRRNAVFIAAARTGPAFVVKQARAQTAATLAREATVLRALATTPALHGMVPEVLHEDREAACLVLRTPPDAVELERSSGGTSFSATPPRARSGAPSPPCTSSRATESATSRLDPTGCGAYRCPSPRTSCCSISAPPRWIC